MKENISLSISSPCSEKWGDFTPATGGKFCGSCEKIVVDFTRMGDAEILDFFRAKPTHICGRLRPDQLKAYSNTAVIKINPGLMLLKAGLVSLLLVLMSKQASAQTPSVKINTEVVQYPDTTATARSASRPKQIIRGVVKSGEDKLPLPGVNVYLKGSTEHTITDADGRFEFPQRLKEGDVLEFNFIGFETQEHIIPRKPAEKIEVSMMYADLAVLGAISVDDTYTAKPSGLRKLWAAVKSVF
ncbi:MAG TPA: carboxypeptidase-like regulatory domain-containing protein [Chryseolinea sp.]